MQTIVSIQNEKNKQHIKQIEEQNRFMPCMRQSNLVYDFHFICFAMNISNASSRHYVIYVCVSVRVSVSAVVKNEKKLKILRDETKTRTVEIKWAELAYLCHKMIQCYISRECEQEKHSPYEVYCLQAVCQLLSILKPHFSPCLHKTELQAEATTRKIMSALLILVFSFDISSARF